MICPHCACEIPDAAKFCPECGQGVVPLERQHIYRYPGHAETEARAAAEGMSPQRRAQKPHAPEGAGAKKKKSRGCLIAGCLGTVGVFVLLFGLFALFLLLPSDEPDVTVPAAETAAEETVRPASASYAARTPAADVAHARSATVLMYMVGSDLESEDGSASADIQEMIDAYAEENVRVVLQTGGALEWHNNKIQSDRNQRWLIEGGTITHLQDAGEGSMLSVEALSDFIAYGMHVYPADRMILIFWDHGGGVLGGFGYDEHHPDDVLTLPMIGRALKKTHAAFDIVGFDACLMATVEAAYMLAPYAGYMIASEETEPGQGWQYTNWLRTLGETPSVDSEMLGRMIVDDFIAHNTQEDTLSVVRLGEMQNVCSALYAYMKGAEGQIRAQNFSALSSARAQAKSYADGEYEMVDIIDMAGHTDVEGADRLIAAVRDAVCCKNDCALPGSNGLSMYFPYTQLDYYADGRKTLLDLGFSGEYVAFFDRFVNVMAGGQEGKAGSLGGMLTGAEPDAVQYDEYDWYDGAYSAEYADSYGQWDGQTLEIVEKGDVYVLSMTQDKWDQIVGIELQAVIDDGEGYIDLGSDAWYEFDADGDLIVDFDYYWVSVNGQMAAYYSEEDTEYDDGTWLSYGYVPAVRNGSEQIDIMLRWDDEHPDGYVAGYRARHDMIGPLAKGLRSFIPGDVIALTFDYYTYDGEYSDTYTLGSELTVPEEGLSVSYDYIGELRTLICFMLTDIYGNTFWTETVEFWFACGTDSPSVPDAGSVSFPAEP